jgi:hypothetical protein
MSTTYLFCPGDETWTGDHWRTTSGSIGRVQHDGVFKGAPVSLSLETGLQEARQAGQPVKFDFGKGFGLQVVPGQTPEEMLAAYNAKRQEIAAVEQGVATSQAENYRRWLESGKR